MTKDFIPYTQALQLRELGFDEAGYGHYADDINHTLFTSSNRPPGTPAPLYQQAFRWFREKHNLRGFIGFRPNTKQFDYHIYDMSLSGKEYVKQRTMEEFNKDPKVGTYEEAERACLIKLIEIVKATSIPN